jgi:putative nucleotidyltransferase with HDIG domain
MANRFLDAGDAIHDERQQGICVARARRRGDSMRRRLMHVFGGGRGKDADLPQEFAELAENLMEARDFGDLVQLELERSKRGGRPLSILIGELMQGTAEENGAAPPATKRALHVVATVAQNQKRQIDSAALIGDSGFGLVLPDTDESGALVLAERLRGAIGKAFVKQPHPSVCFGIASFPRHGRTPDTLVGAANRAVQAVRALGGDRSLLESAETPSAIVCVGNGDAAGDRRLEILLALAETVDIRDQGTAGHSQTVGRYAEQMARELGFAVKSADRVRLAGMLHDLGKVGVPGSVLRKPGPLDEKEREQVMKHSEIGARLIEDPELADVREWVLAHQERPDGHGYPHGLRGEEIPLEARILAVADAYESMTSMRPYRSAMTHESAQVVLSACAGSEFDERVVAAFMRVLEREGLRFPAAPALTR